MILNEKVIKIFYEVDPLASLVEDKSIYDRTAENITNFVNVCTSLNKLQLAIRIQTLLTIELCGPVPDLYVCIPIAKEIIEQK